MTLFNCEKNISKNFKSFIWTDVGTIKYNKKQPLLQEQQWLSQDTCEWVG